MLPNLTSVAGIREVESWGFGVLQWVICTISIRSALVFRVGFFFSLLGMCCVCSVAWFWEVFGMVEN
ncbi:hypothetical protein BDV32DRAFT_128236, partial [Aspergillus pseudonomiae]